MSAVQVGLEVRLPVVGMHEYAAHIAVTTGSSDKFSGELGTEGTHLFPVDG